MSDELVDVLPRLRHLSDHDVTRLVRALIAGQRRACSAGEAQAFVDWCEGAIVQAALVGCVLVGTLVPYWSPGEDDWCFLPAAADLEKAT